MNVNAYCDGDPVDGADPDGLDSMLIIVGQPHHGESGLVDYELARQLAAYAGLKLIVADIVWYPSDADLRKMLPKYDYISAIGHGQRDLTGKFKGELAVTMRRAPARNADDEGTPTSTLTGSMIYEASLKRGRTFKGVFLEACSQCGSTKQRSNWLRGAAELRGYPGLTSTLGAFLGVDIPDMNILGCPIAAASGHPRLWTLSTVGGPGRPATQWSGY